jgi:hypothetical protein
VPVGVDPIQHGERKDDNIVYDIDDVTSIRARSQSGWGHPSCSEATRAVGESLPSDHPIRSAKKQTNP